MMTKNHYDEDHIFEKAYSPTLDYLHIATHGNLNICIECYGVYQIHFLIYINFQLCYSL